MDFQEYINEYHIPYTCEKCSGVMVYQGVGEYKCEDCGYIDWDDYGKVRNYIEKRHGATAAEIEAAVGVSQRTIRKLLKESRIEIAAGSKSFLFCESCGANIRSGRLCHECEMKEHRKVEEKQRIMRQSGAKGYGMEPGADSGRKRFTREK